MIIDIGPTTLLIRAKKDGKEFLIERSFLEDRLNRMLSNLKEELPILKQKAYRIKRTKLLSSLARRMVFAANAVCAFALTPMASVAGSISDFLLEEILAYYDPDFVFLNNGGDISIFNKNQEEIRIGLSNLGVSAHPSFIFKVRGREFLGVATSGFGGRSFTMGICDSVTVFAENGSLADAAATYICSSTFLDDAPVRRVKAKELDPSSDLGDELVVVERGKLSIDIVERALIRGYEVAKGLKSKGVILDAFLTLQGVYMATFDDEKSIELEVIHGGKKDSHYS